MAKIFGRQDKDILKMDEYPLEMTKQNDIVSDTKNNSYIRREDDYHNLTDNVKDINGFKPDENNKLDLLYVQDISTDETINLHVRNENTLNKDVDLSVNIEAIKRRLELYVAYVEPKLNSNVITMWVWGDYEKTGNYAYMSTSNEMIPVEYMYIPETNLSMLNFNFGENDLENSYVVLEDHNGYQLFRYNVILPNLNTIAKNDFSYVIGSEELNETIEELKNNIYEGLGNYLQAFVTYESADTKKIPKKLVLLVSKKIDSIFNQPNTPLVSSLYFDTTLNNLVNFGLNVTFDTKKEASAYNSYIYTINNATKSIDIINQVRVSYKDLDNYLFLTPVKVNDINGNL